MKGDVSFTFLDRIREIELNMKDRRWQSALGLSLTLPDICGGIACPELVKRYRDGRVMTDRYGNPARDTGAQYICWFDTWAAPFFRKSEEDEEPYLTGERCWQLRCEYLHQNKGFINDGEDPEVHFSLGINCGSSICQLDQESEENGQVTVRLDIQEICLRLCMAAQAYYDRFHEEKDFGLYNTPVIDFIKWQQESEENRRNILILTADARYGAGIAEALSCPLARAVVCTSVSDVKRRTKKRRVDVWILEEQFLRKDEGMAPERAVVITSGRKEGKDPDPGHCLLEKPFTLEQLREAVKQSYEAGRENG